MSRLARGALCALLLSLSTPATASAAIGDRPLRMGMHGKDVRMLQAMLSKAGFVTVADGRFGRRTRRSVGRWEGKRDRSVDGVMSRADQLALRREFETPISTTGPQIEAPDGVMLLGGKVLPSVTAQVSSPEGTYLVRLGDATAGASAVGEPEQFELRHHVFPIAGEHDLGRNPANRFGGGRGHQGQDMFARCGAPVRAAQGGTVVFTGYDSAAGIYLVIRGSGSGEDYVYMHLRDTPKLAKGDEVKTGERIAHVGQTGRADGCHLHFELWTKPGWYSGGQAYDPLPKLREWDGWS